METLTGHITGTLTWRKISVPMSSFCQRFFPKTFDFDILISKDYILKVKQDRYVLFIREILRMTQCLCRHSISPSNLHIMTSYGGSNHGL